MAQVTFVVGPAQRLQFQTRSGHYYTADETQDPPVFVVETDHHQGAVEELRAAGYKIKNETGILPPVEHAPVIYEVTPEPLPGL